jgi:hypothetical protein
LALARVLNSQSHRTFAPVVPMQWLLTHSLSGDAQAVVRDWVHGCYLPAKTRLLQRADGLGLPLTFQDFLPWGGSQLQQELPLIEVTPGQRSGLVAPPAAFSRDRRYDETKCWAFSTFFCP